MNKILPVLIVAGVFFTFCRLAQCQAAAKPTSPVATVTVSGVDSGPLPFSNAEANFYRRAWPIDKSHSLGALILFGVVVVSLLALIIRQMAKSGPRKPPIE